MPELDEKKRIIEYDTVNDPDENYYALIDNGTAGTGKVSIKGLGPADMISDQYSDSSTYKVGDLCIHNNKLYVCTVAINTPHAFNLSEWELDTLGNYASQIKQSLSQLGELIWTNNNPSNTFAGQTLNNLDLSKYKFLLVVYKRWITVEDYEVNIIYKDKKCLIKSLAEVLNYRSAECTNTSITWSDSNDYQTYGSSTKTVQNNRNVPYKIFGLF